MGRKVFLDYVWEKMIRPQIGYSFSIPHDIAYSIEAVQEANLATKYNPLFWQCACLSVNSGSSDTSMSENSDSENSEYNIEFGDESVDSVDEEFVESVDEKTGKKKAPPPNYGKIGKAVGDIQREGVRVDLPNINKAELDFVPDIDTNSIIYSLKAITGVNMELGEKIISNRSYNSMFDFLEKIEPTNVQMISMIKAGCFDSLYPNKHRKAIMADYIRYYVESKIERKTKLTMVDFKKMIELEIVPSQFELSRRVMNFKNWMQANEFDKVSKRFKVASEASLIFFEDYFIHKLTLGKDYDRIPQGYSVKQTAFNKVADSYMEELKEYLSTEEAINKLYEAKIQAMTDELSEKYLKGSVSKWEMDSLHYYYHDHELKHIATALHKIRDFSKLPEEPVILEMKVNKKGVENPVYDTCSIAGTVLNADNNKHIVTLLTHCGVVVDVKFYKGTFIWYNKKLSKMNDKGKKETVEDSWFARGNLLLIHGFRRELTFIPRSNYSCGFKHSVGLITDINEKGIITLKTEREEVK
jgi:DNA polymerase-3 subunit alpha